MNDDFEIKVTTDSSDKKTCRCDIDKDDYEYDEFMDYDHPVQDPARHSSDPSKQVTMWENSYETMAEKPNECFCCDTGEDDPITNENCGTPKVVTYQKVMTCDENPQGKKRTITIRVVKRY